MIKFIASITAALLLTSGIANAGSVKTGQQAATVCKTHLKSSIEGLKRLKLSRIRSSKTEHTISFAVLSEAGRSKTTCVVNRADDSITIVK